MQPGTGRLEACHCNVLHLPTSLAVQEQGLLERWAKTSHCSVLLTLEGIHHYQHRTLYIYSSLIDMSCRFTQLAQKLEEIILISQLLNGEDTQNPTAKVKGYRFVLILAQPFQKAVRMQPKKSICI